MAVLDKGACWKGDPAYLSRLRLPLPLGARAQAKGWVPSTEESTSAAVSGGCNPPENWPLMDPPRPRPAKMRCLLSRVLFPCCPETPIWGTSAAAVIALAGLRARVHIENASRSCRFSRGLPSMTSRSQPRCDRFPWTESPARSMVLVYQRGRVSVLMVSAKLLLEPTRPNGSWSYRLHIAWMRCPRRAAQSRASLSPDVSTPDSRPRRCCEKPA